MNAQTVTMQFDSATAATLRALMEKAQRSGQTLNALLQPLTEGESDSAQERQMTADERADELVQWLKAHSVAGVIADDSRESIYTRNEQD